MPARSGTIPRPLLAICAIALLGLLLYARSRGGSGADTEAPRAGGSRDAGGTALALPGESSCELGVVTGESSTVLEGVIEADALVALLEPRFCGGACDALRKLSASPMEPDHQLDVDVVTTEDWPLPPRDTLDTVAPGLTPADVQALESAKNIVVIHTHEKTQPTHLGFRTCVALAAAIAEKVHGFVYDETLRRIESAADFKKHLLLGRTDEPAFRPDHIVLQSYVEDSGEERMVSLGMARFGSPDLEARGFREASAPRVALLLNAVAGALADGAHTSPVPIGTDDVARVNRLNEREIAKSARMGEVLLVPQEGHAAGDPDNALLTLTPPSTPSNAGEAWDALLAATTGGGDALRLSEDLPELVEIGKRVRADLPRIIATYKDHLHLKARFATDAGAEVMWILVTTCKDGTCKGTLENQPVASSLSLGQEVNVRQADVEDYLYVLPDGGLVGGESTHIIEQRGR